MFIYELSDDIYHIKTYALRIRRIIARKNENSFEHGYLTQNSIDNIPLQLLFVNSCA